MQRTFLSSLSLLMLLNLLVKPVYLLLIEAEVQNRVGSEVFGHYAALLSLGFLLNIFLDLGINTFTSRTVSQSPGRAAQFLSSVLLLRLALALVYFVLLGIGAYLLGYDEESFKLLLWIGVNQLLAATVLYVRANLSGLHLFRQDAWLSVIDRALAAIVLAIVLWQVKGAFDIRWLIGTQTLAYGVAVIVGGAVLLRKSPSFKFRWRPRFNRTVLGNSIPYALLVLLMMAYYKTDTIMLERMRSDGAFQAGIYAMGYRLFEAANMLGFLFATLLLPMFSKALKNNRPVNALLGNAFRLVLAGGIPIAVLCFFWPGFILSFIYDHDIAESSKPFTVLMAAFVFMTISHVWGSLLTANGNMRALNWIAGSAVLLNIGLNFYLIPIYGAYGSAATSLATQILVVMLQIILSGKLMQIKMEKYTLLRTILVVSTLVGAGYLINRTNISSLFQMICFAVLSVLVVFSFGLVKMVKIKDLLRENYK